MTDRICPDCGTDLEVEREVFGNDKLFTGHACEMNQALNNLEQMAREWVSEVDKACIIFEEVEKSYKLTLRRLQNGK